MEEKSEEKKDWFNVYIYLVDLMNKNYIIFLICIFIKII